MQSRSFELVDTDMNSVSRVLLTEFYPFALPGGEIRQLRNADMELCESYLRTGGLESYAYQVNVYAASTLRFRILHPHTHLLYHLDGRHPILYAQQHVPDTFAFRPHCGTFIYVPQTEISLHIAPGRYRLQGFTLPPDLFDGVAVSGFDHLADIVGAQRRFSQRYQVSFAFEASLNTRRLLDDLHTALQQKPMFPKITILTKIQELVVLSRDKIHKAQGLLSHHDFLVQQARDMITSYLAQQDKIIRIREVADSLCIQEDHLNRLHRERYGISLRDYRNSELLKKAERCLCMGLTIKMVTSRCGFADQSGFCRFFKKESGRSPRQFIRLHVVSGKGKA